MKNNIDYKLNYRNLVLDIDVKYFLKSAKILISNFNQEIIFLPISRSCPSSLVELTLADGDVVFLECDCGGGGGGGGMSSVDGVGPLFWSNDSTMHWYWDDGEFNLVEPWLRFDVVEVGMIDREGGKSDDKVSVVVDSSFGGWGGGCWTHTAGVKVVDLGSWLQTVWDNSKVFGCSVLILFTGL